MNEELKAFKDNLHPSATFLSQGKATVLGRTVDAIMIRTLYGQEIVWGHFSVDRGKLRGKLANNAATEGVDYDAEAKR
jgi:hypothetical protein